MDGRVSKEKGRGSLELPAPDLTAGFFSTRWRGSNVVVTAGKVGVPSAGPSFPLSRGDSEAIDHARVAPTRLGHAVLCLLPSSPHRIEFHGGVRLEGRELWNAELSFSYSVTFSIWTGGLTRLGNQPFGGWPCSSLSLVAAHCAAWSATASRCPDGPRGGGGAYVGLAVRGGYLCVLSESGWLHWMRKGVNRWESSRVTSV